MELVLDKWARALGSSTEHWHNWEQYSDRDMEFGKVEGNLGIWEKIFGDLGVDFGTTKFEHFDRWGQYCGCWDDWIAGSRLGETLGRA